MLTKICPYCQHILTLTTKDYARDDGYDSPNRWIARFNTESCTNCGYFKRLGRSWIPTEYLTRKYWNTLPAAHLKNHTVYPQKIGDGFKTAMKPKPLQRW